MLRLESLLAEYRLGLADSGLPVFVEDETEIASLERSSGKRRAGLDLCEVSSEEKEFYSRFRSHLFLNDEKDAVRETITSILDIQSQKARDRAVYDYGATGLKDRHESLLQELAEYITPKIDASLKGKKGVQKQISKDDPLDLLLMKSLDVIIETYKWRMRKNKKDFEVFHPLGMARAVSYVGQYFGLDERLVRVMQLCALRHDLDELMQERIPNYKDPSDYFRSMDQRIRNFVIGKLHAPLGQDEEDILDAATIASIMLTKPPAVFWDESVKAAVYAGTANRYLQEFFPDDVGKWARLNGLIRNGVILVKLADLNYNMVDFDDVTKKGEKTFTLRARARAQYKSFTFFNLLSRSVPEGALPEVEDVISSMKRSLMYRVRDESLSCLEFLLKSSRRGGNRINMRYFSNIDDHLITYELEGRFDKATQPALLSDVVARPHYRFDGKLYSMQKEQDRGQMKKGYGRKQGVKVKGASPIRFGNAKSAFDYFFPIMRLSELCYMDSHKVIKSFTLMKINSDR